MSDFNELIEALAARSKAAERQALTEEATKTAVVLPFIQTLGFDVFNLDEVTPEFISDIGTKKGEKVDFVIKIDGKVSMLIEVKPISCKLGDTQFSQLFHYFHVTEARLAILTNGKEAWFFSDTEEPNKMDQEPFFVFNFQKHDKSQINELARFQKHSFAIDTIIEAASTLKYIRGAADYIKKQLDSPDEEFIRLIGKKIYDGSLTKSVMEQLRPSIQNALDEIIRNRIQETLNIKIRAESPEIKTSTIQESIESNEGDIDIETTKEEVEGFMIVRAIAAKFVPIERIVMRDAKSYCAILMDDNNRRPICRLYFNSKTTKNIGLFDADKVETKLRIEKPTDIYTHVNIIETTVKSYVTSPLSNTLNQN